MPQVLFGEIIQAYRVKAKKSQNQVAMECGFDRGFISLLERNKRQPSLATVFKLAKSLHVKASQIVQEMECFESNVNLH